MGLKENIKQKRIENNLTLEELARKVGKTKQTVQKYESGVISNIPSDIIEKLASALNTSPEDLMGWDKKRKIYVEAFNKELIKLQYLEQEIQKDNMANLDIELLKAEDEISLIRLYRELKENGKNEAIKRIKELTYIPDYCSNNHNTGLLNAAHADGEPTEEDIKKTNEIMDNNENWD